MIKAIRYHDISCGHRVYGHENKCKHLHGHNYRFWFECQAGELDQVGRVIDFGVIKATLCQWLEDNLDHKMLLWCDDPLLKVLAQSDPGGVKALPFNPTAENLARLMVDQVAPHLLENTDVILVKCVVEETRKCSASYEIKY